MRSLAVLALALAASTAFASHTEPAKGTKATFALVNAYVACFTPNTETSSMISACAPAVPEDVCALSASGSGKFSIQAVGSAQKGNEDIRLSAAVSGLTSFCEGAQLKMTLSFRATSDDCPEGSCTTYDYDNFELFNASCFVTNGKCKIKTTLSAAYPGLFANGKNTGITLRGCGLKKMGGPPYPKLECGIVVK